MLEATDTFAVPCCLRHPPIEPTDGSIQWFLTKLAMQHRDIMARDNSLTESVVKHMIILVEKILLGNTYIVLSSSNVKRIVLVAMMISAKVLDDFAYDNRHWAFIGGININELNILEVEVLDLVGWRVGCSSSV